jgi:hypothetical protein
MRKLIVSVLLLTSVATAIALLTVSFPGWDQLTEGSPDIIIARCTKTPLPVETPYQIQIDLVVHSDIEVVSILKGVTNGVASERLTLGPTVLRSMYWPRQGEYYLIFSSYHEGYHQAIEDYRVIPLGLRVPADAIAGKPLDEQLQILFKRGLFYLNREIQKDEEEKQRLESALPKPK